MVFFLIRGGLAPEKQNCATFAANLLNGVSKKREIQFQNLTVLTNSWLFTLFCRTVTIFCSPFTFQPRRFTIFYSTVTLLGGRSPSKPLRSTFFVESWAIKPGGWVFFGESRVLKPGGWILFLESRPINLAVECFLGLGHPSTRPLSDFLLWLISRGIK